MNIYFRDLHSFVYEILILGSLLFFCSYALVHVEIKNQGEDAFKPEIYGDVIILERRITDSTSSTVLKDYRGLKSSTLVTFLPPHLRVVCLESPCITSLYLES